MRKTRQAAEQTREAILDAAEQVFHANGVAGGSLEEVARVAGVTRGAVYWHFQNKQAIFLAIAERACLPVEEALRNIGHGGDGDPLAVLERCILSTFRSHGTDREVYVRLTVVMLRCDYVGEMAAAADSHAEVSRRLSGQFERYFRDTMAPGQDAATWKPEVLGRAFFTTMHGALVLWLRDPAAFPLHVAGADAVRALLDMVRVRWKPQWKSNSC